MGTGPASDPNLGSRVDDPAFIEEAHRQSRAVSASQEAEADQAFVESVSERSED